MSTESFTLLFSHVPPDTTYILKGHLKHMRYGTYQPSSAIWTWSQDWTTVSHKGQESKLKLF